MVEKTSNRANKQALSSAQVGTDQTGYHSDDGRPANWQLAGRVPVIDIVFAMPEHKMLQNQDNGPGAEPVGHEQQEVVQCLIELTGSRNGDDDIDYRADQRPDSTIDALEGFAKHLHREAEAIIVRNIIGNDAQRQQDEQQRTETAQRLHDRA